MNEDKDFIISLSYAAMPTSVEQFAEQLGDAVKKSVLDNVDNESVALKVLTVKLSISYAKSFNYGDKIYVRKPKEAPNE